MPNFRPVLFVVGMLLVALALAMVVRHARLRTDLATRTPRDDGEGMDALDQMINQHVNVLKLYRPYSESDHVLNMAYNLLAGGTCLEGTVDCVDTVDPDKPLAGNLGPAEVRQAILDERLFELMDEAKRRADLIRHGLWTSEWYEKPAREGYRILMPIPQTQLDANPLLVQNPGY